MSSELEPRIMARPIAGTFLILIVLAAAASSHWQGWVGAFVISMGALAVHIAMKLKQLKGYANVAPPAASFTSWLKGRRERTQGSLSVTEPVNGELSLGESGALSPTDEA